MDVPNPSSDLRPDATDRDLRGVTPRVCGEALACGYIGMSSWEPSLESVISNGVIAPIHTPPLSPSIPRTSTDLDLACPRTTHLLDSASLALTPASTWGLTAPGPAPAPAPAPHSSPHRVSSSSTIPRSVSVRDPPTLPFSVRPWWKAGVYGDGEEEEEEGILNTGLSSRAVS